MTRLYVSPGGLDEGVVCGNTSTEGGDYGPIRASLSDEFPLRVTINGPPQRTRWGCVQWGGYVGLVYV